jgi:penicillin-binding protein 1A
LSLRADILSQTHMTISHRARRALSVPRLGRSPIDHLIRVILAAVVIIVAGALFALAWLPTIGSAGRMVQQVSDRWGAIGAEDDLAFPQFRERSTIYAADGSILATLFLVENRKVVRLEQVNDVTRRAVLAIEDTNFYQHRGLDYQGILRAFLANVRAGDVTQGASTITQQLVRNVFPEAVVGYEQTLERKVREARLALRIEQEYSKDEILELYLNEVYFGRGVYGIGTAAEYYFSKSPNKLTLSQAAMLAGLIAAPERYSPVNDRLAALERRNQVIERMLDVGWISLEQAETARARPMKLKRNHVILKTREPYFVEYIKQQILADQRFGDTFRARKRALFQGGLKIYTTLDPRLQRAGVSAVKRHLPNRSDPQGAVASVDVETGAIRALVGGRSFKESQVNLATGQGGTGRQSGSAFKPFTLAAAFLDGMPAGKVYDSANGQVVDCGSGYPSYQVFNADGGGQGFVNLWTATENSINAVFVQLASDVGHARVAQVAKRMGIRSELEPVCSLTLGTEEVTPLEMASAYTTLANEGVHCTTFGIRRVLDRDGDPILHNKHGKCRQVIPERVSNLVAAMLQRVVCCGTGTAAALGTWPVFGKTGTTNDYGDAWFVGCTRQRCSASWVGHLKGRVPMTSVHGITVFGGTFPARIWHDFMLTAMRGLPALGFPPPPPPAYALVPNVVGKKLERAEKLLAKANFTAQGERVNSTEPAGTVVGQTPGAGSRVEAGSLVTLEVSNGIAPKVRVPRVIGLSVDSAKERLQAAGLVVAIDRKATTKKSQDGVVFDQAPNAGTRLKEGSRVVITAWKYEKPDGGDGG